MNVSQLMPPAAAAVTLSTLKAHLRLSEGFPEADAEDDLLGTYLTQATSQVENHLDRALIRRPVVVRTSRWTRDGHVVLPIGPVQAVTQLAFVAEGREPIIVDTAHFNLEAGETAQRITGPGGNPLPAIPQGYDAEISVSAGYGETSDAVPAALSQAVLLLAAYRYENRVADARNSNLLPGEIEGLLAHYRRYRV